jgi:hypothetical protein
MHAPSLKRPGFRILNDDFAGRTTYDTAMLYRDGSREGL